MPKLTVITPCYFNEGNIPIYAEQMLENESRFPADVEFEYILVDDGSKDGTWRALEAFRARWPLKIKLIKLVRNFGSTNAVFAALAHATGDCHVVISADLQDPPSLILKMFEHWQRGYKLVLAHRENREESLAQKLISNSTHGLIRRFGLKNLPRGGFDLNLFDREIRDILLSLNDKNSYFPYLLMWLGYDFVSIPYVRQRREVGKSTYTLAKKIKIFVDAFVAFSYLPIRLISGVGLSMGGVAVVYGLMIIHQKLTSPDAPAGWSSMMVVILFVSAFQMVAMGIIGEYVWRALDSSRQRPNYIVDKVELGGS